jgi:short-subunit dehydrogenase
MRDIRGSRAIVTGASRGVGTYIAKTLAAQGVSPALAARDATKLEDTRGRVRPWVRARSRSRQM